MRRLGLALVLLLVGAPPVASAGSAGPPYGSEVEYAYCAPVADAAGDCRAAVSADRATGRFTASLALTSAADGALPGARGTASGFVDVGFTSDVVNASAVKTLPVTVRIRLDKVSSLLTSSKPEPLRNASTSLYASVSASHASCDCQASEGRTVADVVGAAITSRTLTFALALNNPSGAVPAGRVTVRAVLTLQAGITDAGTGEVTMRASGALTEIRLGVLAAPRVTERPPYGGADAQHGCAPVDLVDECDTSASASRATGAFASALNLRSQAGGAAPRLLASHAWAYTTLRDGVRVPTAAPEAHVIIPIHIDEAVVTRARDGAVRLNPYPGWINIVVWGTHDACGTCRTTGLLWAAGAGGSTLSPDWSRRIVNRDVLLIASISNPSGELVPPGTVALDIQVSSSVSNWLNAGTAEARARGAITSISVL